MKKILEFAEWLKYSVFNFKNIFYENESTIADFLEAVLDQIFKIIFKRTPKPSFGKHSPLMIKLNLDGCCVYSQTQKQLNCIDYREELGVLLFRD